jgi:Beta-lactamase enzyme family
LASGSDPVQRRRRRTLGLLATLVTLAVIAVTVSVHAESASSHAGGSASPADPFASGPAVPNSVPGLPKSAPPNSAPSTDLASRVAALVEPPIVVSVSVLDVKTGSRFDYGATAGMVAASISKLDILESLLLAHQSSKTPISAGTDALATAMIEHSDNDAGQSLWNALGSAPAIAKANVRLGLTHTVPDPNGYYGLTMTGAGDQVALLHNLVNPAGPLDATSQAYALGLLHGVEQDQTWGVTAAADQGSVSAVKNGWLAVDADNDRWAVNSDGIVALKGQQVLISVMTAHNPSEQAGIDLIQDVARAVAARLS